MFYVVAIFKQFLLLFFFVTSVEEVCMFMHVVASTLCGAGTLCSQHPVWRWLPGETFCGYFIRNSLLYSGYFSEDFTNDSTHLVLTFLVLH